MLFSASLNSIVRRSRETTRVNEETRLTLWEAFSDFFLDTELTERTFQHAARVIASSGVSLEDAEAVLWNEVFPALHWNFQCPAGEWAGWSREWLKSNLQPSKGPARQNGPSLAVEEIRRCWEQMIVHLRS